MHEIIVNRELAPKIRLFEVHAPNIAAKAKPGQFIILVIDMNGERIPLTIADCNINTGTISFVFNEVGKTTKQLSCFKIGNSIPNIAGPLGVPSEIRNFGNVLCVGGGVMTAPLYWQVRSLKKMGNNVTTIIGARKGDLLIFETAMKNSSNDFFVTTDDGSKGFKGLDFLKKLLKTKRFDRAIVMGPVITMNIVSEMTRPFGIITMVTLTPIMIDGMGMCGVCRVTVGGETKFACIDGPEFDGHKVDFDELIKRQRMFLPEERLSSLVWEKFGGCCHDRKT